YIIPISLLGLIAIELPYSPNPDVMSNVIKFIINLSENGDSVEAVTSSVKSNVELSRSSSLKNSVKISTCFFAIAFPFIKYWRTSFDFATWQKAVITASPNALRLALKTSASISIANKGLLSPNQPDKKESFSTKQMVLG